jgi:hypothetical protein
MAKNTRKVTHYETYEVRRHWSTKRKGASDLVRMTPVAVFDDKALAETYIKELKANPNKDKNVTKETFEIMPNWNELEPKAENFSLPFNVKYTALVSTEAVGKPKRVFAPKDLKDARK